MPSLLFNDPSVRGDTLYFIVNVYQRVITWEKSPCEIEIANKSNSLAACDG